MYILPPKRPKIETEPGVNPTVVKIVELCFVFIFLFYFVAILFYFT